MIRFLRYLVIIIIVAIESVDKNELLSYLENEVKIRIDYLIEGAIELAEEVHAGVKREDGTSSFLETHTWPVTLEVVRHYKKENKLLTSLQISGAMLHDIMEDNEKILDLYVSKTYGFEAYFMYRFGDYIYKMVMDLKIKPIKNYSGHNEEERKSERFHEYCDMLANAAYDIKTIKLADRINNMQFVAEVPGNEKIQRYLKEAEDFYIAYTLFTPRMNDFYSKIRSAYDNLKKIKVHNF
jgi:(p)ppGpp synthase/HD superfamily hydrolase